MYTIDYKLNHIKKGYTTKKETSLLVKFRFGQDVAPKDRKEIKDRIKFKDSPNLSDFIYKSSEKQIMFQRRMDEDPILRIGNYYDHKIGATLYFDKILFRLGFNLSMKENKAIPLEKIIDLKALNKFILTGEGSN